jgi:glycerophosphoryl diester phosphodiesterase
MKHSGLTHAEHLRLAFSRPIAHRGLFANPSTPENGLGAFSAARDLGFAIECDVRLSADGVLYAFHDDTLERLAGQPGLFQDLNASEVDALRLMGGAEKPPRVSDLLATVAGRVPLVVELKTFDAHGWDVSFATEAACIELLRSYLGPVVVKSFNPHSVLWMRRVASELPCGLISCDIMRDTDFSFCRSDEARQLTDLVHPAALEADFISYNVQDLSPERAVRIDRPLMVWTVRTAEQLAQACRLADAPVFERGVVPLLQSGLSFRAGTMHW